MRGRKRKLGYRKYLEKKSTRVPRPLMISLPLTSYTNGPVDLAVTLHSRITSLPLPPSWVIDNALKVPITLCKLRVRSGGCRPRTDILITLTIDANMKWVISFVHQAINPDNCSLLGALPPMLTSVTSVANAISLLNSSKICSGNSDSDFLKNWQQRSLTLHNSNGTCTF